MNKNPSPRREEVAEGVSNGCICDLPPCTLGELGERVLRSHLCHCLPAVTKSPIWSVWTKQVNFQLFFKKDGSISFLPITNYHKLGGLQQQKYIVSQVFWPETQNQG